MYIRNFTSLLFAIGFATFLSCNGENKPSETNTSAEIQSTPSTVDVSAAEPIYSQNCATCHQANGEGIPGVFPELKASDFLKKDKAEVIKVALNGSKSSIIVNGTTYSGGMMNINEISDKDGADVINYILNSWGNNMGTVTESDVAASR